MPPGLELAVGFGFCAASWKLKVLETRASAEAWGGQETAVSLHASVTCRCSFLTGSIRGNATASLRASDETP